jgi:hypothetical protein
MDLSKISRNDWIVVGGFVLMLIAVSLKWYGWSLSVLGQTFASADFSGWHFFLGWFPWLLTLIAAVLVLVKAIPSLNFTLPVPEAMSVMALGVVAFVLVLIRLIASPGTGASRGIGIFIGLIATAVVAAGGFLKNSEPAS